jgi:hypothetical protein
MEKDLDLRIAKSEIEEAWYLLEKAEHEGGTGDASTGACSSSKRRRPRSRRCTIKPSLITTKCRRRSTSSRRARKELSDSLREWNKNLDATDLKLDAVSWPLFGRRVPKIPMVEQVVLNDFEKNNFDQWVSRVDRCMNCHVAIDRAGFEDLPNPMKTHPKREYYLGKHEVRRSGVRRVTAGRVRRSTRSSRRTVTFRFGKTPYAIRTSADRRSASTAIFPPRASRARRRLPVASNSSATWAATGVT